MRSDFRVSVSKDYLVFSSAHFITFRGHQCETLHGHNYRVGVMVEGAVDGETMFVVDFSVLKKLVRKLVDEVDHKVLLPLKNPKLAFRDRGQQREVDYFGQHTYTFPIVDCAMVPIENTTAEMLAQYFATRTQQELRAVGIQNLTAIEFEVEESFGQSATYRLGMSR
ncbi:MAG TPA: 6-carboxytetrahydropterin synthase [Gemmatimonadales bacterium]|nr:6-carboxytetrahydropterin synthase [Gemmatimonadales bacterium]